MSVDIAGSYEDFVAANPRNRYAPREHATVTYEVQPLSRSRIVVERTGSEVVVRDLATGFEASGATYLDALLAFKGKRSRRTR